jgi:hypothetical protein
MRIVGALLLVALLACGPKSSTPPPAPEPEPASIPEDLVRAVEGELSFLEQIAAAAQAGTDCNSIATNIAALADSPDRAAVGTAEKHLEYQKHQAELQARYADRIDTTLTALQVSLAPCSDHAAVNEALTAVGL